TDDARVITNEGERNYTPEGLYSTPLQQSDLYGRKTVQEAAELFLTITKGEGTAAHSAVIKANAAMGSQCAGQYDDFEDCYKAATESRESGKAFGVFKKLMELQ